MFNKFLSKFSHNIGIDLGTANTLVYTKEDGIVINEPTVVAINKKTDQVLAVGDEAKDMVGKTPPHIEVTYPLDRGIISDYEVAEKMLQYFINKVTEDKGGFTTRPKVVTCVPLSATEVEIKAVEDAAKTAGAKSIDIVQESMAAAIGARMPINKPIGSMIVDIGGGNTEAAVISLDGVVTWKSTTTGGDELNNNITQYARDVFNLHIGESYAEQIKLKVGSAKELSEDLEYPMRGRDVITGLPKEIMINDSHIREATKDSLNDIIDHVKMTLEMTPPELTADIHERGILLTGGGALLRGLSDVISDSVDVPVRLADDPLTSVARGTGTLLEEGDLLEEVSIPISEERPE
ncbi:MAG: rod shape-determining protein [Candidatus Magasanikbacteria bacterium]